MDLHKEFLEFTEYVLSSHVLDEMYQAPDLHKLLACIAEGGDVYGLMADIPDDKIGEVLAWVMNVDLPQFTD